MIVLFPRTVEDARQAPGQIKASIMYINGEANRFGRPVLAVQELAVMGYKLVKNVSVDRVVFKAVKEFFARLKETGRAGLDQAEYLGVRNEVEAMLRLDEYYRIEEETVEKKAASA